jgi:hypothetical protein
MEVAVTEVYIDGVKQALAAVPGTWGDLLAILDDRVTTTRLLVTEVRLDGVEEPAFRHPSTVVRSLATVGRVDVEVSSLETLLRQSCVDAAGGAAEMADQVLQLGASFRLQDLQAGHAGLARLAEDLRTLVMLLQTIAESPGFDRASLAIDGVSLQAQLDDLDGWLGSLVSAQATGDWLTVSDVLEYDLEPMLRRLARNLLVGGVPASP